MRWLIFLVVFCQTARAAFVAVSAADGSLVELDASAYFSFSEHESNYLPLYMPARHTCEAIIDAQLVYTDMTYRIDDWYYMPAGTTEISVRVSIVDLAAFTAHAFETGVWSGQWDCDIIWQRLSATILRDLFVSITQPMGSLLTTTSYGMTGSLYCGDAVCAPVQLVEVLKVSPPNGVLSLK